MQVHGPRFQGCGPKTRSRAAGGSHVGGPKTALENSALSRCLQVSDDSPGNDLTSLSTNTRPSPRSLGPPHSKPSSPTPGGGEQGQLSPASSNKGKGGWPGRTELFRAQQIIPKTQKWGVAKGR